MGPTFLLIFVPFNSLFNLSFFWGVNSEEGEVVFLSDWIGDGMRFLVSQIEESPKKAIRSRFHHSSIHLSLSFFLSPPFPISASRTLRILSHSIFGLFWNEIVLFLGTSFMTQKGWNTNTNDLPAPSSPFSNSLPPSSVSSSSVPSFPQAPGSLQNQSSTSLATSRPPNRGYLHPVGFNEGGNSFANPPSSYSPQQPQMRNDIGMGLVFSMGGQVLSIEFEKAMDFLGGFGEQLFARTSVTLESLVHYEDLPSIFQVLMGLGHGTRELMVRMVTDFGR